MNRTRKIVAAGIGTAVILVIIAMMLLSPNLHTQSPATTSPPGGGGTVNGGNGTNGGSGPGVGGNTTSSCNQTGDDHEWDDHNETDANGTADHAWNDANETNDSGSQGWDECSSTAGNPDRTGDLESERHASAEANLGEDHSLTTDVLAFAQDLSVLMASAESSVVSLGGIVVGVLAGVGITLRGILLTR